MRLTPGLRRSLALVAVAAAFPAFAVASRALSPGGEAGLRQRSRTLRLQPLLDRLGVKPAGSVPSELTLGQKARATVVDPRKLARFGIRGARVGDVVWIEAREPAQRLPAAQAGDARQASQVPAAARRATEQAQSSLQGGGDSLDAEVSSNGRKVLVPCTPPAGGLPTNSTM